MDCYLFADHAQKDGRQSCPSWLTNSGQFTRKVAITSQPIELD